MTQTKVISYSVKSFPKAGKPVYIEYPELEKLLEQGYQIQDTLPPWGTGNVYYQTFVLQMEDTEEEIELKPKKARK